ncbi:MAG: DUF5723 family protein [Bacteroidia bacterium]|nr:DUF5723 family protein [Bacteroidia bacterium]
MRKNLFILLLCFPIALWPQFQLIHHNLRQIPQTYQWNPALIPQYKFYWGTNFAPYPFTFVPFFNSFYANKGTAGPALRSFFTTRNDSVMINTDAYKSAKKMNYTHYNTELGIFSFGFRNKEKNYLHFYSTLKNHTWFGIPKDLMKFIFEGNAGVNAGKELNLSLRLNHHSFLETGFSFAREIKQDKLFAGGTVKIYNGIANIQTKKNKTKFITHDTAYEYNAQSDILINVSSIIETPYFHKDSLTPFDTVYPKYDNILKNLGTGIDLGVNYVLNDKLSFNAAIIDFGFIRYKTNARNLSFNGNLYFPGIDIKPYIGDSVDYEKAIQKMLDSLAKKYDYTMEYKPYTVWMPLRLNLQGIYSLNDKHQLSFLSQTMLLDKKIRMAASLGYIFRPNRWFNLSLAYQLYNRSYSNLGFGFAVNLGFLQWYVMTDNVFGFTRYTSINFDGSEFKIPTSRNINVRTGCNWTFGAKPPDRDKDGIIDKKDLCPNVFGLAVFQGCPDTDNDSIPDKDDACPKVAGVKYLKGCPDRDGDKITDTLDACPDDPGPEEFKGCPDRDGDKIIDKEDECPDTPGLAEFKGCPDKDGDKIPDKDDACPDDPGLAEFKGCPDRDGDKIIDKEDACPDQFGLPEFKGCPDKDGDKIIDKEDACPEVKGVREYKGCPPPPPKLTAKEQKIIQRAFSNLEFETGKDIIRKKSYPSLNELAALMKQHPDWILTLSGHTDNQGTPEFNLVLSEKRSKAVKNYLAKQGVNPDNMVTEWFGDTRPIADNKTPQGRQKNRRVEMKVSFKITE